MMYKVSFDNGFDTMVSADSMREAELQSYCAYGMDAIGVNVNNDEGDFCLTVARKAWEDLLSRFFNGFTMEDVYNHLLFMAYAWVNFPTESGKEFDYEDGEWYEYTRIGEEGRNYLKEHDRLGNYMDEIGFRW